MNRLTLKQRDALYEAFRAGVSSRVGSAMSGTSPQTYWRWKPYFDRGVCATCNDPIHTGRCARFNVVTKELAQAIIEDRLRTDDRAEDIGPRHGVSAHTVYRVLKNHPRKHRTVRPNEWSYEELDTLRMLWATARWPDILAALPKRRREGIARQATYLNLRRPRRLTRTVVRENPPHPVIERLAEDRYAKGISSDVIAKKIGADRSTIISYELGAASPIFSRVVAWATTLGYEVVLKPIAPPAAIPQPFSMFGDPAPVSPTQRKRTFTETTIAPAKRTQIIDAFKADLARAVPRPVREPKPPPAPAPRPTPKPRTAHSQQPAGPRPAAYVPPPPRREPDDAARTAELAAMERFLTTQGATRVPGVGDPAIADLPPMIKDRHTKKFTRRIDAKGWLPPLAARGRAAR